MSTTLTTPGQETQQQIDLETPEQKYARLYSQPIGQQPVPVQTQSVEPVAPPVMTLPPEVIATLESLRTGLDEVRTQVTRPQPTPNQPTPTGDDTPGWVELIRQGRFKDAEASLIATTRLAVESSVKEKAYQDALSATQVQLDIDRHLNKIRGENPDIARFERYLESPVNARVEAARAAGKIKTSSDFIREYKNAVDEEVKEFTKIGLQYRADGAQRATTRTQEVRNVYVPNPTQVNEHSGSPQVQSEGENTNDYFARRAQSSARLRNLT